MAQGISMAALEKAVAVINGILSRSRRKSSAEKNLDATHKVGFDVAISSAMFKF
jgi:6,7-dimethyl-8-ribityllumazine synthase